MFSFNYPPRGWALCNGQIMAIAQNQALFSLLGITYGGDGRVTFALPNLQGRTPLHFGNSSLGSSYALGGVGGTASVTLLTPQMPIHGHQVQASSSTNGAVADPTGAFFAPAAGAYGTPTPPAPDTLVTLSPATVPNAGGSQPHTNMMPYLVLNYCIALTGIFPSRN
jgi:microcystin-dependent protein